MGEGRPSAEIFWPMVFSCIREKNHKSADITYVRKLSHLQQDYTYDGVEVKIYICYY